MGKNKEIRGKKSIHSFHAELLLAKFNEQGEDVLKKSLGEVKGCKKGARQGRRNFGVTRRKASSSGCKWGS